MGAGRKNLMPMRRQCARSLLNRWILKIQKWMASRSTKAIRRRLNWIVAGLRARTMPRFVREMC
jgi:hypothetical protein